MDKILDVYLRKKKYRMLVSDYNVTLPKDSICIDIRAYHNIYINHIYIYYKDPQFTYRIDFK